MAAAQEFAPALDETIWQDPIRAQELGGIHENTILFYFLASPFCEKTSNNSILFTEANMDPNLHPILYTRQAFEGQLQTMAGIEYLIAQEPAEMAPGTGTGVWVIRKQKRSKVPGGEDEVVVLATYFVVGLNVYMAPSVGDVLSSRLLSIIADLKKFVETTSSITKFTPASGHTWLPPRAIPASGHIYLPPRAISRTTGATAQGRRVSTPMVNNNSANARSPSPTYPDDTPADARLLTESIHLTSRYGDVYMDESPITGEPGDSLL